MSQRKKITLISYIWWKFLALAGTVGKMEKIFNEHESSAYLQSENCAELKKVKR